MRHSIYKSAKIARGYFEKAGVLLINEKNFKKLLESSTF